MKYILLTLLLFFIGPSNSFAFSDAKTLITEDIIKSIKKDILQSVILNSIEAQNTKRRGFSAKDIDELDKEWRQELNKKDQYLIAATLSSPVSSFLKKQQIDSKGLYDSIMIMDQYGLNVGQSDISSDYWQGDEDKFLKTFAMGKDGIFIDIPEYNEKYDIWITQISFTITQNDKPIGAATIDVNLTELERRINFQKSKKSLEGIDP